MSWLNPSLLGWVALAVVPLILHFFMREQVQKVAFSALRFLRKQGKEVLARKRWLEWLLTALRVACVAGLVLAFARPFPKPPEAATGKDSGHGVVVLLDTSRSMAVGSRFTEARDQAEKLFREAADGDALSLITFADGSNIIVTPAPNKAMAIEAVRASRPSGADTDILAAMDRVQTAVHTPAADVHLISDLQATGVAGNRDPQRLPKGFKLHVHKIGKAEDAGSLVVQGGAYSTNVTPAPNNMTVAARIYNSGAPRLVDAELIVDGQKLDQRKVAVPQNGDAVVTLTGTMKQVGEFAGHVLVKGAAPALPGDDRFHFVTRVVNRVKVAIVNGNPTEDPRQDAAFFLAQALNVGADSPYAAEVFAKLPDLPAYQVVVLAGVNVLSPADMAKLKGFVEGGGGLLIGLAPNTPSEAFNNSIGSLAPARLRSWNADGPESFFVAADGTHPLVAHLVADGKGDIAAPRFGQTANLKDSQDAHVVLRFNDQRPALLEIRRGKGQVAMLASSLDRRAGDFPLRPIFLPFVREAMRLLVAESSQQQALLTGETLALTGDVTVTYPDNTQRALKGEPSLVVPEPGIYKVASGGKTALYAVNGDPKDSNLAAYDDAALTKLLEAGPELTMRVAGGSIERVLAMDEQIAAEHRLNLGWWCLIALLGFSAVELYLAQYASRQ